MTVRTSVHPLHVTNVKCHIYSSTVPNGRSPWTWKMTVACQLYTPSIRRWIDSCQSRVFFSTKFLLTRNTYDISSIKRVTRKIHVVVVQNNGKEMYKKMCCTCKVVFLLISPIILYVYFFAVLVAVLPFRITYIIFVCVNYKYIDESFAFSPG